jgi:hypothetical protein
MGASRAEPFPIQSLRNHGARGLRRSPSQGVRSAHTSGWHCKPGRGSTSGNQGARRQAAAPEARVIDLRVLPPLLQGSDTPGRRCKLGHGSASGNQGKAGRGSTSGRRAPRQAAAPPLDALGFVAGLVQRRSTSSPFTPTYRGTYAHRVLIIGVLVSMREVTCGMASTEFFLY